MPAAFTTLAHFAVSLRTNAASSSGVEDTASPPLAPKYSAAAGLFTVFWISWLIRSTMGLGVAAGKNAATHAVIS